MMLYLTGALDSLTKSPENPQPDANKSLGGYVSSTPVPNGAMNVLFDLISQTTLAEKPKETIALGLINKFDKAVNNVTLKMVVGNEYDASFKVAAVMLNSKMAMEHIASRMNQPIEAEFHDATFQRAFVDIKINQPAIDGEEIALIPFDVQLTVHGNGIEATWEAFEDAFSNDDIYAVERVSENVFRILLRGEEVVEDFGELSYVTTKDVFRMEYMDEFKNGLTGEVVLFDDETSFEPGAGIGLWIQRIVRPSRYPSNEQLLEYYKKHKVQQTTEQVDMVISYNLVEDTSTEEPEVPENPEPEQQEQEEVK